MPIGKLDQRRINDLHRADAKTAFWRDYMPEAKTVFHRVTKAADALASAAEAWDAERADDDPARAARDEAAAKLRETASQLVGWVRSRARLDASDAVGNVTDPARIAAVDAFLAEYLPEGTQAGHSLVTSARSLATGFVRFGYGAQGEALARLIDAYDAAHRKVETESIELAAAQRVLEEARAEADAARAAARAYTVYAAAWAPSLGIDVADAFPTVTRATAGPSLPPEPEILPDGPSVRAEAGLPPLG